MAEGVKKIMRLSSRLADELGVGIPTIIEFLMQKGHEKIKPNAKISNEIYQLLLKKFQYNKIVKEKAKSAETEKIEKETITLKEAEGSREEDMDNQDEQTPKKNECDWCGKPIIQSQALIIECVYFLGGGNKQFCGKDCGDNAKKSDYYNWVEECKRHAELEKKIEEEYIGEHNPQQELWCSVCGERVLTMYAYIREGGIFCGEACYGESLHDK